MTTNNNTLPLLDSYTPGQIEFIKFLQANRATLTVYDTCTVSRKDLVTLLQQSKYIAVPAWIAAAKTRRAGRGNYLIPELAAERCRCPSASSARTASVIAASSSPTALAKVRVKPMA